MTYTEDGTISIDITKIVLINLRWLVNIYPAHITTVIMTLTQWLNLEEYYDAMKGLIPPFAYLILYYQWYIQYTIHLFDSWQTQYDAYQISFRHLDFVIEIIELGL